VLNLLGADWRKSSRSQVNGCVEVSVSDHMVAVRDTKDGGHGPVLRFRPDEWEAFVAGVRDGEFDLV
jgi:Domain of unknown function (DUF397)